MRAERIEIRRSRDLILRAAENHFESHNSEPTMSELALLAGIGNATLWRRFSSIDEVVEALYDRHLERQQAIADEMLAMPTGWAGVVALISGIALLIDAYPAIPRVIRAMAELNPGLNHGARWDADVKAVAARAQDEGMLRADVTGNDLVLAAFRMGEYVYLPGPTRTRIVERQIGILLDGLRADGRQSALAAG